MIAEPLLDPADHTTLTLESFAKVEVIVGAAGRPAGVTDDEVWSAAPVPDALTAETRKSYAVPFVRPVTTNDKAAEQAG